MIETSKDRIRDRWAFEENETLLGNRYIIHVIEDTALEISEETE